MREKKPIVGTIVGVLDGALDGVQAQLMRRTNIGYTVKLLESKDAFRKGDTVHLSVAEFQIHKGDTCELCQRSPGALRHIEPRSTRSRGDGH
jgi:hypothetical protein